jgi:hypothetical protein
VSAKHSIVAALAVAACALAAPAQSRVADGAQVTIFALPSILNGPADQLALSGSIPSRKAGEIVTIQIKECRATWFRGVAAVRTRAGGSWSNELAIPTTRPITTASIRAVWRGEESAPATVRVRAPLTLRALAGSRTRFLVRAAPHWRKRVQIQRLDNRFGTWSTVTTVVLSESPGVARFTASFPRGTSVRAVLPLAQVKPCFLAGTSRVVRT